MRYLACIGATFTWVCLTSSSLCAQLTNLGTPIQSLNSSYYEQNGFQWNAQGPNFFFNSAQPVTPIFGNYDPGSGTRGGFGFGGGGVSGNLNFNFAQGSSRSVVSSTPSLTTMNGYPGSFSSQTIRPFVTGVTPVIGDYPTTTAGQQMTRAFEQQQSSQLAQQRLKAASAKQLKAYERYRRGLQAEEEGDLKKARANFRLALGTATGELRSELLKRMRANGW